MPPRFTLATNIRLKDVSIRNIILANWMGGSWQLLFAINAGGTPATSLRKDMATNGSDPDQGLVNLIGSTSVQAGSWRHLALTLDWGQDFITPTATLYVDGSAAGSASPVIKSNPKVRNPYTLMPTQNSYLLGRKEDSSDSNSFFSGEMSDFRIYTRALTPAEIKTLLS